ncbi:MAG TPA: tRNA (guanine(37)-N(1))-methyltransferase, partial [Thermosynergistes sp.]|nr:tRNA (guanine(37)-N(1))-methyltransferase [Thermosynergistes sp.]
MKRFSVITAFPEIFNGFLSSSIIGRAITSGLIKVDLLDLRDFAEGKHRQVDDYTYGGGGMVLMAEPLYRAVQAARDVSEKATVIFPSPQGVILSQEVVESLAQEDHLVIACGHYEGVDERFVESCVDLE